MSPIAIDRLSSELANASLPLFSGLGISEVTSTYARSLYKAAELDTRRDKQITQQTIETCSDLYKSQAAETLVRENMQPGEAGVDDWYQTVHNGLPACNDVFKAQ